MDRKKRIQDKIFKIYRLEPKHSTAGFDCKDDDLNVFLQNDALNYAEQLMSVTYILVSEEVKIAGFFIISVGLFW